MLMALIHSWRHARFVVLSGQPRRSPDEPYRSLKLGLEREYTSFSRSMHFSASWLYVAHSCVREHLVYVFVCSS